MAGVGIARVLSYQVADHVREGRLRYLLQPIEPSAWPINLLFQANRPRTPNVSAFIAAAQSYCAGRSFGRSGTCGTCSTGLIKGTVDYADPPAHEIGPGEALICVGRPRPGPHLADPLDREGVTLDL